MHLVCPHCRNPIEVIQLSREELTCPSCGSSFHLESGSTTGWQPHEGQAGSASLSCWRPSERVPLAPSTRPTIPSWIGPWPSRFPARSGGSWDHGDTAQATPHSRWNGVPLFLVDFSSAAWCDVTACPGITARKEHSFHETQFVASLSGIGSGARHRPAHADVKMPAIFGGHMVLQQGQKDRVWGWAEPGEAVTVSIAKQSKATKADGTASGRSNSIRCRPAARTH